MQKYKVFINDWWILFGELDGSQDPYSQEHDVLDASENLIFNLSEMIKTGSFDQNIVLKPSANSPDPFALFLKHFQILEAAGGIVQHTDTRYLMIKRFGLWDFPKGKIELGETNSEAALREVQEETGVERLEIMQELPTSYHIYRYKSQWIVKRTYWFLMQSDFLGQLKPQLDEEIIEAIWVPKLEISSYLENTYSSLKELVLDLKLF